MPAKPRFLIFCPAALLAAANQWALQYDPAGGLETFTIPLFPADQVPQTAPAFFWTSTQCSEETAVAIEAAMPGFPGAQAFRYDALTDPGFPAAKRAELGLVTRTPILN
jgi:hypothetical protein